MNILWFNTLDLLLLVLLFIGMLIGLVRGTIPQVISLVSIWLGLVVTLWLYKIFSFRILQGLGMAKTGADTLAFIIMLIICFQAIRLIVKMLATPPEDKRKRQKSEEDPLAEAAKTATERFIIGPLNMLGGMVMGFILMGLWLTLILGIAQFLFQTSDAPAEVGSFTSRMNGHLTGSSLVPIFNSMLWVIVRSVEFFGPADADIFRKVVEFISSQ
jgi:uncharacterized membrane protein required for colicin V production